MRFNEQWLREWVNPDVSTDTLAEQLTMAGLEVDAVEPVAPPIDAVVVGRVLTVEPHPNAERLQVCRVDVGTPTPLSIVCGAKNVASDARVPTALVGATLPGGLTIKKTKLRGVESFGMLCSEAELGLAESAAGLMVLPSDAQIGMPISDYLGLNDVSIELGLTPNRGDCLSVAGIAREVAALNRCVLNKPSPEPVPPVIDDTFPITIRSSEGCPRYVGRVIKGIDPRATTPIWMTERLRRCGLRAINPVVDVTNYVLLELGQPMHAFDLAKLHGGIEVRYGHENESLNLLNGQQITIEKNAVLIADAQGGIALAGIMGGADSAVSDDTQDIFLESAFFSPAAIAGRARRYGLHTDSSHRFERGVDPKLPRRAMERATALLLDIVGGKPGPVTEVAVEGALPRRERIALRSRRISRLLGHSIAPKEFIDILNGLGMDVEEGSDGVYHVQPPGYRFDIQIEADLIEEVARIYGYSQLPEARPLVRTALEGQSTSITHTNRIRQLIVDRGYQEAITYSFVDPELQQALAPDAAVVSLSNPISADMAVMRQSLWPGLVQALRYNQNRQQPRIRLFEIGAVFSSENGRTKEHTVIGGIVSGDVLPQQWGVNARKTDFFDIKSDVEAVLGLTGHASDFIFIPEKNYALHPGQCAAIKTKNGIRAGWVGVLHPHLQRKLDLTGSTLLFQLQLDRVADVRRPQFKEFSKFPAIRRDIAIVVDVKTTAAAVQEVVTETAGALLQDLQLFDVYEGEGVDSGRKSLALGLTLQDTVRTLNDEDVDTLLTAVVEELDKKLGGKLRD